MLGKIVIKADVHCLSIRCKMKQVSIVDKYILFDRLMEQLEFNVEDYMYVKKLIREEKDSNESGCIGNQDVQDM